MAASHSQDSDTQEEWTSLTSGHLLDPSQRHDSCMKHVSCGLQNQEGSHPQRDSLAACLGSNRAIASAVVVPLVWHSYMHVALAVLGHVPSCLCPWV